MAIQQLPGFWDENGAALMQLAQMATRIANPYFDSQVALMDAVRKNPETMPKIVDMAFLNPDMFAQQFGPRMLQQFTLAKPSAEAQVEFAKKDILGMDPSQVPSTVVNEAAAEGLGVKVGLPRQQAQATLDATKQQTSYYTLKQAQEELAMPELVARSNAAKANIAANPNAAQYAPDEMAEEYYNRRRNGGEISPSFLGRLDAMFIAVPESKELFDASLEMLAKKDLIEEQNRFNIEAEGRRNTREDDILDRQIRDDARKLVVDLGGKVNFDEAYKFLKGEESEAVALILRGNVQAEQAKERSKVFRQLNDDFRSFASLRNRNSPEAISSMRTLEGALSDFLGTGVTIERVTPVMRFLGDPNATFRLQNGYVIDGGILGQMINNELFADIVKATDEELVAKLGVLEAQKATLTEQAYNQAKQTITQEQTRRQGTRSRNTSSGARRPN